MRTIRFLPVLLVICLLCQPLCLGQTTREAANDSSQPSDNADRPLRNQDVLEFSKAGMATAQLVKRIESSRTEFDLSPPKLDELFSAGVPEVAVLAMISVTTAPRVLEIPEGTLIEIEAPYTISSMQFKAKDEISFRVVNPVKVNGVTLIEQGATATGTIVKSKRGGHFGKAGLLSWKMESVTATDGTQVRLRVTPLRERGDSKSAKVATKMAITGALLTFAAPLALLHGFKRGGDAFIPAGKRFEVFVDGRASVNVR